MEFTPLASKALKSPHPYDSSYEVDVRLSDPLWTRLPGPQEVAAEMMSFCVQLDSLIVSTLKTPETPLQENFARKVTFESSFSATAQTIIVKMKDCLVKHSINQELQVYLQLSGIDRLFPRVAVYLRDPDSRLDSIETLDMDRYITQLSQLNNVLTISQQLNTDIQNPSVHKYVAHQTAILFSCVNQIGAPFLHYKKDIQSHFQLLKTSCSASEGRTPQLSFDLYSWLNGLTAQLTSEVLSMKEELTTNIAPLSGLIQNIENCPS
jgi:hypothetical protein